MSSTGFDFETLDFGFDPQSELNGIYPRENFSESPANLDPLSLPQTSPQPGEEPDIIVATEAADRLFLLGGDDTAYGLGGDDILGGNQGRDFLQGNTGNDILYGGQDGDTLRGGKEDDLLFGDRGEDILFGDR
jgi:Ca2+-binding RTX toxin-like protein